MKSVTKSLLSHDEITNLVKVNFAESCQIGSITDSRVLSVKGENSL